MERRLVVTGRRSERVADVVRHELARLLREVVRDPQLGFVTITDVELSPDLRHARVWVSALGDDPGPSLDALRRAAPFLRRSLARAAGLRVVPDLRFSHDPSVSEGSRVERLLREASDHDEEPDE
jgi:ribosome-binding factor A